MIIRHRAPEKAFVRLDRYVLVDSTLSDGAVRLYCFLNSFPNGADYSDEYICKAMDISSKTLARRKVELKERGLILVDQISPRHYIIYIGSTKCLAHEVRNLWEKSGYSVKRTQTKETEKSKVK